MNIATIQRAARAAEPVTMPEDMRQDDPADAARGEAPPPPPPFDQEAPEAEAATFDLNDYGNGRRLAHYYGQNLKHVPRLGWFRWDGQRWVADEDAVSVRADAQKIGARIMQEIPFIALSDWQRDALDKWLQCKAEYAALEEKLASDRSDEEKARFKALVGIRNAGQGVEGYLTEAKKAHRSHAKTAGNSGRITNMMGEASVELRADVTDLNADPDMVNARNGVLHFTKVGMEDADEIASYRDPRPIWGVHLLPHETDQEKDLNRGLLITKMMDARYDPKAPRPTFDAFLEVVQPDPEIRDFLQTFAGYSLLGRTTEQKLLFNYGIGRNGKSTLVDLLADIFADYGTTLPIESLTGSEQRKGSEATPDLVRLPGARFVRASEPEQGTKMKEALIKALTGGEAILIRRMHAEFIEIVPEFKLWISGNHKPEIRGADDGIWRRVMLVPWSVQIPDDEVDKDLPAKLRAERDGILAWLVEGALRYLNKGLPIPEAVLAATQEYRTHSDPMREFLLTECEVTDNPEDRVTAPYIRDAFNAWRLAMAEATWTSNTVSRRMAERAGVVKSDAGNSFDKYRSNGQTGWKFLKLNRSAIDRLEEFQVQVEDINRRAR
jgi:putative DNA primase/helicase